MYPDLKFPCNGFVTKWIFGAKFQNGSQAPEFQIWLHFSGNIYVGLSSSYSSINAGTMIGTNLYEFIPQIPLPFFKGDIFGLYMPSVNASRTILYAQNNNGPLNLRVGTTVDDALASINEELMTVGNYFPLVTPEFCKHQFFYYQQFLFFPN